MAIAGKPANRAALPKAKWKILLVGDYPSSQKARAEILEKQGYAVDMDGDADEARARWQPYLYDVVLVDVERNPSAGIKFCQEIGGVASPTQQESAPTAVAEQSTEVAHGAVHFPETGHGQASDSVGRSKTLSVPVQVFCGSSF